MAENSPQLLSNERTPQRKQGLSRTNVDEDGIDARSDASSASTLQMSMLENRLESEMTKMATMVKNTVSSLQNTISSTLEQFERKFAEIDHKLNSLAAERSVYANHNENRNTSLFSRLHQTHTNSDEMGSLSPQGNSLSALNTQSNQNGITTSIDRARACESISRGDNSSGTVEQTGQSCSNSSMERCMGETHTQSKGSNHHFKMKPQNFDGTSDFDEFLCQFEITCEINAWRYKEKSLYLANCLTGDARSLLNELDTDGRRDYDTLIEKLKNRFGSVNRSEIYRTQLKSRTRNKGETIQELAQAIKKLVRQAYPGVNKGVIETLSLDNFIDAITDSDIRMRVRELSPKSLEEAEQICVRLEAYKIADKQRSRLVGRLDAELSSKKEESGKPSNQFEILSEAISTLTAEVKNFSQKNAKNTNKGTHSNQRYQGNNQNYNRNQWSDRSNQNNRNRNGWQRNGNQYRGSNSENNQNRNHGQPSQNAQSNGNQGFAQPHATNSSNSINADFLTSQHENMHRGNLNQSGWRATTRHH